jgi:hypothetical protein
MTIKLRKRTRLTPEHWGPTAEAVVTEIATAAALIKEPIERRRPQAARLRELMDSERAFRNAVYQERLRLEAHQ